MRDAARTARLATGCPERLDERRDGLRFLLNQLVPQVEMSPLTRSTHEPASSATLGRLRSTPQKSFTQKILGRQPHMPEGLVENGVSPVHRPTPSDSVFVSDL